MPRAKLRTPALRDQVLRAAVATLAEQGVAGFTARRVADVASTSVPAVYELFGDKAGLVREVFFDGFRQLGRQFERLSETDDPRADLLAVVEAFRRFVRQNPVLAEVMFSRPFVDFDPGPDELRAGAFVRELIVARVRRTIDAGLIDGNATDIAHVLLAQAQGLAA
ncbi:MAG: TetR/AcrR family transcriptional regulator, partial [Acidimicrobiales bacterium]